VTVKRYTSRPVGTRAHKARRIWDALVAAGERPTAVWFEPIGAGAEMQGPSGGWFYRAPNVFEPIGYNVDQALDTIALIQRRNATMR
jgi:hypothetical protein